MQLTIHYSASRCFATEGIKLGVVIFTFANVSSYKIIVMATQLLCLFICPLSPSFSKYTLNTCTSYFSSSFCFWTFIENWSQKSLKTEICLIFTLKSMHYDVTFSSSAVITSNCYERILWFHFGQ